MKFLPFGMAKKRSKCWNTGIIVTAKFNTKCNIIVIIVVFAVHESLSNDKRIFGLTAFPYTTQAPAIASPNSAVNARTGKQNINVNKTVRSMMVVFSKKNI